MEKAFRPYDPNQAYLFPRTLDEYVAKGDVSIFIRDVVREQLDLTAIYHGYAECQGAPPYNPTMMTALLLYSYSQGVYSSRRIMRACAQRVDFMAVTGHDQPDHRTIGKFRKRHEAALSGLFEQVVQLCAEAGLVKLGHVAIDGTKIRANASKHKSMSYGRMDAEQKRLQKSVKEWFEKAEAADREEDELYGEDKTGDELPDWVANKEERRKRIEEAKRSLEQQAAEQAQGTRDGGGGRSGAAITAEKPNPQEESRETSAAPEGPV